MNEAIAQRLRVLLEPRNYARIINYPQTLLRQAMVPGLKPKEAARLEALEGQLTTLKAAADQPEVRLPELHPNLAYVYRDKVALLREALEGPDAAEVIEVARALIDRIVISPPDDEGGPPGIEVEGELMAILKVGGLAPANPRKARRPRPFLPRSPVR